MSESELYGQIMLAHSNGPTRLWRQQSGVFYNGKVQYEDKTKIILSPFRRVRVGMPGVSDLGGMTSVVITPDMVGKRIAAYLGIEGKTQRGRLTPEQTAFIELVRSLGGRAGIARSVEDAANIIAGM